MGDSTGWASEPSDLRAADSDRERYVAVLRRHCAEGRLTLDEFEDRVGEVYSARTFAELDHSLRELPREPAAPRRVAPTRRRSRLANGEVLRRVAMAVLAICIISAIISAVPFLLIIGGFFLVKNTMCRPSHRHVRGRSEFRRPAGQIG